MKKFGYVIAALGAITLAAPTIASAEDGMRHGNDHHSDARGDFHGHRDHGWHRHHDRIVVIRHRHHD
jgi:hypothetical protein